MARLHKTPFVHWLLVHAAVPLLYALLRLICITLRYRRTGAEAVFSRLNDGGRCTAAFFHGDAFLMIEEMRRQRSWGNFHIMVSRSRDGDILARFLQLAGARVARGSSSRGGARALLDICHALGPRDIPALAVDGPRGPRHVVKEGVLLLARRTKRWVQPIACMAEKKWVIRSWDRMEIPVPFSRVSLIYGKPMEVPPDADAEEIETLRRKLEQCLQQMKTEPSETGG